MIGDSSVYGWGDVEGGGWCERLKKDWLNQKNSPIIYQLGVRGDGIEKVSYRWEKEWSSRGETRRNKPKGILLSVGLNDTARIVLVAATLGSLVIHTIACVDGRCRY